MATYVIGDIQGCFYSFKNLLEKINFNSNADELWLVGDIINRGLGSLQTLDWCYQNRDNLNIVLGNHDLYFLSAAFNQRKLSSTDTLQPILASENLNKYVDWMLSWSLIHKHKGFLMVHAGLMPDWSTEDALDLAKDLMVSLRENPYDFFKSMYGDKPDKWSLEYNREDKQRVAINAMTRLRCINKDNAIDFTYKSDLNNLPSTLNPWFDVKTKKIRSEFIISGHWSAIGIQKHNHGITLDTGCVWGGKLSAYCIESKSIKSVSSDSRDLS
jgi:bis(5'-nucleosyl)-tetraphosphatase (symmetrical)